MKVLIQQDFRDKNNYTTRYNAGSVVDFPNERAESLIEKGLAKLVEGKAEIAKAEEYVIPKPKQKRYKKNDDSKRTENFR